MSLDKKLKLLNLSEEQEEIAKEKFMASLALVTLDEFTESLNYLQSQGVSITKANQVKVLTNLCHDLTKKFSVLGETKETDIYRQEPNMLNKNVIDVYRRFQKCNQDGISYKNEDGTYKTFILTEKAFQKELTERTISETPVVEDVDKMSFEPTEVSSKKVEPLRTDFIDINEFIEINSPKVDESKVEFDDTKVMDIKDYHPEIEDPIFNTTTFKQVREELKGLQEKINSSELIPFQPIANNTAREDFQRSITAELNFDGIDFENLSEGMGRAA